MDNYTKGLIIGNLIGMSIYILIRVILKYIQSPYSYVAVGLICTIVIIVGIILYRRDCCE